MHYLNADKRLDEWLPQSALRPSESHEAAMESSVNARKRKRGPTGEENSASRAASPEHSDVLTGSVGPEAQTITEEEYDIQHHKQITAKRNFDKVIFGRWEIKTW